MLAHYLNRVGWSPERLASEVNRVAGAGTISVKAPYGWLKGSYPRGQIPYIIADILADRLGETVTVESVWSDRFQQKTADLDLDRADDLSWDQAGFDEFWKLFPERVPRPHPGSAQPLPEAQVMYSVVDWLTAVEHPFKPRTRGEEICPLTVDVLAARVAELRRLDEQQGSSLVLEWVDRDLRWVITLIRSGSFDQATGARLYRVLAEYCQLAGWVAGDLALCGSSQEYFLAGLRAAHIAGDRDMGANIVSCLSYQNSWSGRGRQAFRLIQMARKGAGQSVAGAVHALLATREARANARMGEQAACERALVEAAELFESGDRSNTPVWARWINRAVLVGDEGRVWLDLGQPKRAEESLEHGLRLFGHDQPRNRLLHHISLAQARLGRGEVDGAAEAVHAGLDVMNHLGSQRARLRLGSVAKHFATYSTDVAQEITDRIRHTLSTAGAFEPSQDYAAAADI